MHGQPCRSLRRSIVTRAWMSLATAISLALVSATTAAAQTSPSPSPMDSMPGLGAMAQAAFNDEQNIVEDRQGADFAVNADWPLSSGWRVRGEFGRAGWSFDGSTGLPTPLPPERITITRLTGSMIRSLDWQDMYVGGGGGAYHFASELTPVPRPTRPGLHLLVGMEVGSSRGGLAARLEAQYQAVGGPNDPVEPGAYPVTGMPPNGIRSRVSSEILLNLVFGIGIGWRF